jgi:uncharacterized membrane protein required for colicin V production
MEDFPWLPNFIWKKKEVPAARPGLHYLELLPELGSAALLVKIFVFFVLTLTALFLSGLLSALLTSLASLTVLAGLSRLVALLTGLIVGLTCLSTLLPVLLHIVCHEIVLPFRARNLAGSVI